MRIRMLIAAAVISGGIAACSKPVTQASKADPAESGRQIRLAEPAADRAVVSDLEAHQPLKATSARRGDRAAPAPVERAPAVVEQGPAVVEVGDAPAPEMSVTTSSAAPMPGMVMGMRAMPVIPLIGSGHVDGMSRGPDEPGFLSDRSRGPIMIRGGMGGIDDKCDTRGGHRAGVAINRSTPSFGGYPRGGIR